MALALYEPCLSRVLLLYLHIVSTLFRQRRPEMYILLVYHARDLTRDLYDILVHLCMKQS